MRAAVFMVMLRTLARDPAALAMSFVLPGVVFVIFAAIFSGATGGDLKVRMVIVDERADRTSQRLVAQLLEDKRIVRLATPEGGAEAARALVRAGDADAGLIVRKDARRLDDLDGSGAPALELVGDPAREIAVSLVEGALQQAYFKAVPEAPIRSIATVIDSRLAALTPEQRVRIEKGLDSVRERTTAGTEVQGLAFDRIYERRDAIGARRGSATPAVLYYAGGVAVMFLLFSMLTGAMSYLDQREVGLLDRLAVGPGGIGVLIDGKFLFLLAQGVVQVVIIYLVAWLLFGVALPQHLAPWAVTTLVMAIAAAGMAIGFVTLCQTRQQAQTLGQMSILVLSAVGGSMVPRYLMPDYVQVISNAAPNSWAIEAYAGIFHRGESWPDLWLPLGALLLVGLVGLLMAHVVARRAS